MCRILSAVSLFALAPLVVPPAARAEISVSFFYDALDPYGWWIDVPDYGYCWQPRVDADWHPYTDGYWAYTDYGWTWVSDEDFGWAVYHYGRWVYLEAIGWCWVPDTEWGPGWVSWRWADNYVGWAPLPPAARFGHYGSIGYSVDLDYDIGPGWFSFCETRYFGAPILRTVIVSRSYNVRIIRHTVNVTHIHYRNNRIYNGGLDYDEVRHRCHSPIRTARVERDEVRDPHHGRHSRHEHDRLAIPVVAEGSKSSKRSAPAQVKRKFESVKTDTGWSGVKDRGEREAIRKKFDSDVAEKRGGSERGRLKGDGEVTGDTRRGGRPDAEGETGDARKAGRAGSEKKAESVLQPFRKQPEAEAERKRLTEEKRSRAKPGENGKVEAGAGPAQAERTKEPLGRDGRRDQAVTIPQEKAVLPEGESGPRRSGAGEVSENRQNLKEQQERRQGALREKLAEDQRQREVEQQRGRAAAEAQKRQLDAERANRAEREQENAARLRANQERMREQSEQRQRQLDAQRERIEASREQQRSASRERSEAYQERKRETGEQQAQRARAMQQQQRSQAVREQQSPSRQPVKAKGYPKGQGKPGEEEEER